MHRPGHGDRALCIQIPRQRLRCFHLPSPRIVGGIAPPLSECTLADTLDYMAEEKRNSRLGHERLWKSVIDLVYRPYVKHNDPGMVFDDLEPVDRLLRRRGINCDVAELCTNKLAWNLWTESFYHLEKIVTTHLKAKKPIRYGTLSLAERWVTAHLDMCRPRPITMPSGRVVMPNRFNIRISKVAPATPSDWDRLGIPIKSVVPALDEVRKWWVLVFATVAMQRIPVCSKCEDKLPPTTAGRQSTRNMCRKCENEKAYSNTMKYAKRRAELQQQWRASKQRCRAVKKQR